MASAIKAYAPPLRAAYRYCALSNLHRFDDIRSMIDPNGLVYGSKGVDDIMDGIRGFYKKYDDVFWIYKSIAEEKHPSKILIDFDRYWTVKKDGGDSKEIYCSSATEIIEFNNEGLITSIVYCSPPTEPVLFGLTYPASRQSVLAESRLITESTE